MRSRCRYCPFRLPGGPPLPLAPRKGNSVRRPIPAANPLSQPRASVRGAVRRRARYAAGGGGGGFGGYGGSMGPSIPRLWPPRRRLRSHAQRHEPKSAIALRHVIRSPRQRGWAAIPFSAGGDGVRRSPELPAQLSHSHRTILRRIKCEAADLAGFSSWRDMHFHASRYRARRGAASHGLFMGL